MKKGYYLYSNATSFCGMPHDLEKQIDQVKEKVLEIIASDCDYACWDK